MRRVRRTSRSGTGSPSSNHRGPVRNDVPSSARSTANARVSRPGPEAGEPSRLEHVAVTHREAAKGVARAVARSVVGLHFDQTASKDDAIGPLAAEHAPEEVACHHQRLAPEERRGKAAWAGSAHSAYPPA